MNEYKFKAEEAIKLAHILVVDGFTAEAEHPILMTYARSHLDKAKLAYRTSEYKIAYSNGKLAARYASGGL